MGVMKLLELGGRCCLHNGVTIPNANDFYTVKWL